jgi:hypothetical protein
VEVTNSYNYLIATPRSSHLIRLGTALGRPCVGLSSLNITQVTATFFSHGAAILNGYSNVNTAFFSTELNRVEISLLSCYLNGC